MHFEQSCDALAKRLIAGANLVQVGFAFVRIREISSDVKNRFFVKLVAGQFSASIWRV